MGAIGEAIGNIKLGVKTMRSAITVSNSSLRLAFPLPAIFAAGYPASSRIQCDSSAPGAVIEETVNAGGGSSLSYSAGADRYNYVRKTEKAWKGTCRMRGMKFTGSSEHFAEFRFR